MKKIAASVRRDRARFKGVLAENGYFWDINRLHERFRYDSEFSPEEIKKRWACFLKKRRPGGPVPVDFYIHIPFCRSRCEYCLFFRSRVLSPEKVEAYIDCLISRFKYFSPLFRGRRFRHLYVGGGTPSMLGDGPLKRLLSSAFENFEFSPDGQRTMETNPQTARASYFRLLRSFGFNRVSLGVQSLNPAALKANSRGYQDEGGIIKALKLARAAGFEDINTDLIAGLAGDTPKGVLYSFARLAKLAPNNIVLYGLMPPDSGYLDNLLKMTRRVYFMKHYPRLIGGLLPLIARLADKYGYVADSFDQARWHWGFRHKKYLDVEMRGGYGGEYSGCILGFGHGAKSRIHNDLEYREVVDLEKPSVDSAVFEGRLSGRREEMVKFVINRLDQFSALPRREFAEIFGVSAEKAFPYAVAALRTLGCVRETPEKLVFTFKRPADKYVYALFFFSELNVRGPGNARSAVRGRGGAYDRK